LLETLLELDLSKRAKKRGKGVLLLTMSHTPFLVLVPVLLSLMLLLRGDGRGLCLGYRNRGEESLLSGYGELTEYSSLLLSNLRSSGPLGSFVNF